MKTKLFLAVALAFSFTVISCGNKKAADASSEVAVQVCDSACTKAGATCCANDSVCNDSCKKECSGKCDKASCEKKKGCDKACAK